MWLMLVVSTSLVSVTFNQDNLHSFPHLSKYGQFWSQKWLAMAVIPNLKLQNGGPQTEFPNRRVGCKIKAVIWKRLRRSADGFITTSDPFTSHTVRTYSSQSARCSFTSLQYEIYVLLVVFRSLSVYTWGHESLLERCECWHQPGRSHELVVLWLVGSGRVRTSPITPHSLFNGLIVCLIWTFMIWALWVVNLTFWLLFHCREKMFGNQSRSLFRQPWDVSE